MLSISQQQRRSKPLSTLYAILTFVIKNTGCGFLGKSLDAGALSVWTHNLKFIEFVQDYKSDSGYVGSAFKVAAGVMVQELHQAADKHNVTVTSRICESVEFVGGYVAEDSHTPMSGYYDMAADNIEALQVVIAAGHFISASSTCNLISFGLYEAVVEGNETAGGSADLSGNRIFLRGNWEDAVEFERMFTTLKNHSRSGRTFGGYHQTPQSRLNVDKAVPSAFRNTVSFLIGLAPLAGGENATQSQLKEAARELAEDVLRPWRRVSPESDSRGSYLNEANVVGPVWQRSF
ncbi:hypothetical protein GQ44DRAFT_726192 [Phaeosphaeriaceae sp. PMI808]|nr:hypothetical protein GQ44DRAFT_726192 [Phaeosphaeriaceae sp. PMI808]